ncbi:hypothetical protein KC19_3G149500 [Ceratodon purpureus]|uniref:Uncharacterized protein n=1 Tax=Ceratodon purpureus TaxID=3225 RepID=A0A8T0IL53_CERPU|nr:hypothetical protein KC19_3G149500 [Ceratodon purpureus]
MFHRAPVLDSCFHDDSSGFTASTDSFLIQVLRIFWDSQCSCEVRGVLAPNWTCGDWKLGQDDAMLGSERGYMFWDLSTT